LTTLNNAKARNNNIKPKSGNAKTKHNTKGNTTTSRNK
jgi:hypothetical protein